MDWRKAARRFLPVRSPRPEQEADNKAVVKVFRKRYGRFRRLLDANAALAELMAELEDRLGGTTLFGTLYVRTAADKAITLTGKMADSLDAMSNGKYPALRRAVQRIANDIRETTQQDAVKQESSAALVLSLREVNLGMVDTVGGKCANLGEMLNDGGVPVPRGFAVTIAAFHYFFSENKLPEVIEPLLAGLRADDLESLSKTLDHVRGLVENAPLPQALSEALDKALRDEFGDEPVRLSVRSSALAEDGQKSFAGQFLTILNVQREQVEKNYKKVIASIFTPSATLYRLHQGLPYSTSAMAVGCLEMVDAKASGVAYSHDPVNLMQDTLIINAIWGLGKYAVDGVVNPDLWVFSRTEPQELVRRRPGLKDKQLVVSADGELVDAMVPEDAQKQFCLSEEEAGELARYVMRLEEHYGDFQDIEWAKTADDRLVFLQSRPLDTRFGPSTPKPPKMEQYRLLLEGGDIAYPGIGCGPVVIPRTPEELLAFPKGGVLVAQHSSAEYAAILDKAQAVITRTGGVTGHMATICREYRVPTLLNAPDAMRALEPGMIVTLDAFSGRVYEGEVTELFPLRLTLAPVRLQDTPVFELLRKTAKRILPLHLTDPDAANFSPAGCQTLHDVMRFAHEVSYQEMFAISDSASHAGSVALKLNAPLPIDLHIIDLEGGVRVAAGARSVKPEEVTCVPLQALLGGMLRPDVLFRKPRPINMGGFMSVMSQQMANPRGGDARFGDKSYAIISDRYMNFSSRVGYHYSVLDAYCGMTVSKNYVSFSFQGGAAGEERRIRRIKAIALVLEELDFAVMMQGDMLKARFQKYPKEDIALRLDQLGRLLQVTRQLDMLMVNNEAIVQFKDDFMNGIYR
ncbi:phosphoenolpyruvate synthase [Desulfovibrio sp. OttesenSCG-928-G15]|nr:phosphoenolpyruvate synthase [Desulfovibrio sp. OttesenSCG-928-G15]